MQSEIVHTIGCTGYFLIALLFLWMSRIPRTKSGPGWWASAMVFALTARLAYHSLVQYSALAQAAYVYSALVVVEKALLAIGLVEFLGLKIRHRWFWGALLIAEIWVVIAWANEVQSFGRNVALAFFNTGFLIFASWATYRHRGLAPNNILVLTSMISALLVIHWISAFIIVESTPTWRVTGFLLGTGLVLIQYLSLLAAVLSDFQRRLMEAEASALDMAFQDALTGLNNQRYMNVLFEKALVLANRPHQYSAIIFIDLDNFKPINDLAGHHVGDEVLKTVAHRLKCCTRSTDICARIGGDEFAVICTQLDNTRQVSEIADKLLRELISPVVVNSDSYVLGASIGISLYPMHGEKLAQLLECADNAMYEVKKAGKNSYRIYSPPDPRK